MPENTVMPIDLRALAPAPLATTSGATPRMKANDVIRIGRNRARAASTADSSKRLAVADMKFERDFDNQNGVLG